MKDTVSQLAKYESAIGRESLDVYISLSGMGNVTPVQLEQMLLQDPEIYPKYFPSDMVGSSYPLGKLTIACGKFTLCLVV
jgi:hypothetical protein